MHAPVKREIPKSLNSFSSDSIVLARGEEDELTGWCTMLTSDQTSETLKQVTLRILIQNLSQGTAKMSNKSALLTLQGKPLRQKAKSGSFVESTANEKVTELSQILLASKEAVVTDVVFPVEEDVAGGLLQFSFVEIPIKLESKGVVKLKLEFDLNAMTEFTSKSKEDYVKSVAMVD